MKIIDIMNDTRSNCYSIMLRINIEEYLDIVREAYSKTGNIEGQRTPIKSKTGKKIRDIMSDDIMKGAILPPIVLGSIADQSIMESIYKNIDEYDLLNISTILTYKSLSIIDGMQRTTALMEVAQRDPSILKRDIRVEVWITNSPNNLIYRMLVLNTGQISWSLKKQLEVVFSHIADAICSSIPDVKLITSNEELKSRGAGEYQLSHMVELYLAFATRKENIDLSKEVTERFAKLDIIDLSSNFDYLEYFIESIDKLVKLDKILCSGKRIFGDQYARIALIVSISKYIFGKTSILRDKEEVVNSYKEIMYNMEIFIKRIEILDRNSIAEFCALDTFYELTEGMGKLALIEFYKNTFNDLVNSKFKVESLEECWRA